MQPPAAPCQEPAEAVEDYPGFVFERVRDSILAEAGPRDEPHYADKLTVLLTTSPVVSNPDTTMIEVVLSTVAQIPGLLKCRFVVVCDGCCVLPAELFKTKARKSSYRGGRVPGEEGLAMYEEYKARVRELMARPGAFPGGAEVLELPSRHGFGMAVQEGLQHVHTPYVMVIQHDRAFCRPFDVAGLLECMEADPSLKMVALLNKSMYDHARRVLSCGRIKLPKCGPGWRLRVVVALGRCPADPPLAFLASAGRSASRQPGPSAPARAFASARSSPGSTARTYAPWSTTARSYSAGDRGSAPGSSWVASSRTSWARCSCRSSGRRVLPRTRGTARGSSTMGWRCASRVIWTGATSARGARGGSRASRARPRLSCKWGGVRRRRCGRAAGRRATGRRGMTWTSRWPPRSPSMRTCHVTSGWRMSCLREGSDWGAPCSVMLVSHPPFLPRRVLLAVSGFSSDVGLNPFKASVHKKRTRGRHLHTGGRAG